MPHASCCRTQTISSSRTRVVRRCTLKSAPPSTRSLSASSSRKKSSPRSTIRMGGQRLTFSASGSYLCNLCGSTCVRSPHPPGRETDAGCPGCVSTVRLRGLAALLSKELFGTYLALPDFPEMKGLRGFGMSDPPSLAEPLAKKFDYTNTFYHQPPMIDIT